MRLLLDTHTFLWYLLDDPRLSETAGLRLTIRGDPILHAYPIQRLW